MAELWHSSRIRWYCPTWRSDSGYLRDVAIRASYVFLHQVDLILTILAVSNGFSELNPLMRSLLTMPLQLLVAKLVIPLFIAWLIPSRLLLPAILLLSIVVGWNIKELLLLLF